MFNSGNATPFTMPVQPAGYGNGGMGGWGDDWIALAIIAMIFGGNGFGFGGWGGGAGLGMMEMFLPFMFMNGGWGFGNNGTPASVGDVQRGFDNQSVMNKLNGIEQGICSLGYDNLAQINGVNTNILQGFNGVDNAICNLGYQTQQGFNGTNMAIAQLGFQNQNCCCQIERNIDSVRFENAQNTCAITNAIHAEGEQTRALINANTMQDLRDKLADKDRDLLYANFQNNQTQQNLAIGAMIDASTAQIIRRTGNDCPVNAYVVQPPQPVTFPTNCCGGVNYAGYGNNGCDCNRCC